MNLFQFYILNNYLNKKEGVSYTAFNKPHPLDNFIILRFSLMDKTLNFEKSKENIVEIINKTADIIIDILNVLQHEWENIYK